MTKRSDVLLARLAQKCTGLKEPIHVLAVCSGGRTVGKYIKRFFRLRGIKSSYHEVWTNIVGGQARVWKTDFKKRDYIGTALVVEDVIWFGRSVNATKKMLNQMKRQKVFTAVLLDFNKKADFSIFS